MRKRTFWAVIFAAALTCALIVLVLPLVIRNWRIARNTDCLTSMVSSTDELERELRASLKSAPTIRVSVYRPGLRFRKDDVYVRSMTCADRNFIQSLASSLKLSSFKKSEIARPPRDGSSYVDYVSLEPDFLRIECEGDRPLVFDVHFGYITITGSSYEIHCEDVHRLRSFIYGSLGSALIGGDLTPKN